MKTKNPTHTGAQPPVEQRHTAASEFLLAQLMSAAVEQRHTAAAEFLLAPLTAPGMEGLARNLFFVHSTETVQTPKGEREWVQGANIRHTTKPDALARMLAHREANGWNCYFGLNLVRGDFDGHKAKKTDVRALVGLHADLDPGVDVTPDQAKAAALVHHDDMARDGLHPVPSIVNDSGGGIQAIWLFDQPLRLDGMAEPERLAAIAHHEAVSQALAKAFEVPGVAVADSVQNIDRVLRVPGSLNQPTAHKRKKGRVDTLGVFGVRRGPVHSTAELEAVPVTPPPPPASKASPTAAPQGGTPTVFNPFKAGATPAMWTGGGYGPDALARDMDFLPRYARYRAEKQADGELRALLGGDLGADNSQGFMRLLNRLAGSLPGLVTLDRLHAVASGLDAALASYTGREGGKWDRLGLAECGKALRHVAGERARDGRAGEGVTHGEPTPPAPPLRFTRIGELMASRKPTRWLVRGYLQPNSLSFVIGPPGTGKSLLALDWACCLSLGREWRGSKVSAGAVAILAGEGHYGMTLRAQAWGIEESAHDGLKTAPLFISDSGRAMNTPEGLQAATDALDAIAAESGPLALLVIDTLNRNYSGDENSASDFGKFLGNVDALRARFGCAVLVVHHTGHAVAGRGRGTSAILGSADTEFQVVPEVGGFRLECSKMKDGPKPPVGFYALKQIPLGWLDDEGEEETSVVLTRATPPPQELPAGQTGGALEALRGLSVATEASWRDAFYAAHPIEAPGGTDEHKRAAGARKKAFARAVKSLVGQGLVTATPGGVYSVAPPDFEPIDDGAE